MKHPIFDLNYKILIINSLFKMLNTRKIIESFIFENETSILNANQIRELSRKTFSFNAFALNKGDKIFRDLISSNELLFGIMNKQSQGILITPNSIYFIAGKVSEFSFLEILKFNMEESSKHGMLLLLGSAGKYLFENDQYKIFTSLISKINKEYENIEQQRQIEIEEKKQKENNRIIVLNETISSTLESLDKNNDGEVDLIENEFNNLFSKNQKLVMNIDKNYIHQFVKISNFIKQKKQNTQKIFESIRDSSNQEELEVRINLLKNQIHAYELLVFHSINMIGSLVSEDLITFYEIYESFDKLGMFNSNWENEVSAKLTNIGDKLDDLMYSIYSMEQNIVDELSHLSYVTQESFENLNRSVIKQLKEVESSINTNNLLAGIQAYQLYKINKNTRSLRD